MPLAIGKGVTLHGRYLRKADQNRRNCGMVDNTGRRYLSRSPVDLVPRLHVCTSRMVALALGSGYELAVHPDCLVLGSNSFQSILGDAGSDCPLVDVLVEETAKANALEIRDVPSVYRSLCNSCSTSLCRKTGNRVGRPRFSNNITKGNPAGRIN
jgi:hypothetical protein